MKTSSTHAIEKTSGPFGRERKTVKTFASADQMNRFLNASGPEWSEHRLGLAAGVYAYAGGRWHNVKRLDSSFLAHI